MCNKTNKLLIAHLRVEYGGLYHSYARFLPAFGPSCENTTALLMRSQGRWETSETEESRETGDRGDLRSQGRPGRQRRQRDRGHRETERRQEIKR